MKLKYRVSPSIKTSRTTTGIMNELTLALVVVWLFAVCFYATQKGMNYATHILGLTATSAAVALVCEFLYAKLTKIDFKKHLKSSYPHVTVLILILISAVNVSYYAMIVATVFAIGFAKLVFGGFGQNIFNPAAIGRVVIMSAFGTSIATDLSSGATPVATLNSAGWTLGDNLNKVLEPFGGILGKALGWHAGSLGETSAILLLVIGIVLVLRKVIDYRIPVFYVGSIALFTFAIALFSKQDLLMYPLMHIMSGGVMFAAVFMLTDPVTSPLNTIGRTIFAVGAAFITVVIRMLGATPDGVVYSIVLMNMLVPLIDYALAGNQVKMYKKSMMALCSLLVLFTCLSSLIGMNTKVVQANENVKITNSVDVAEGKEFTVESKGFQGLNEYKIVIGKDGKVVSVENTKFADTVGIGDMAISKDYLDSFKGISETTEDVVSGATFTSNSVIEAVKLALSEGGK